ncbi:MAG: hypothetical protein Q4F60_03520, partial [Candidatus Saccharibacteria bacterium]|nr:hypothetical protein [Candidatus Saccharibacteria bacterium]
MYYEVIPTKIFNANSDFLTYFSDQTLLPGQLVKIPLGKTTSLAIINKKVKKPDFPTKPIKE